jgi:[NiFe] hydrogenase assembly HybE family chaperone
MNDRTAPAGDPSDALVALYEAVQRSRMQGLPIVNPALAVEAVAFAPWGGRWLGIMVTPWFMNVVLAPLDAHAWQPLAMGEKRFEQLPAGDFEFIGAFDERVGEFRICSLFSPVLEFEDQATARFVARTARDALLEPAAPAPEAPPGPLRRIEQAFHEPQSRARFLHAWLPDRADGPRG